MGKAASVSVKKLHLMQNVVEAADRMFDSGWESGTRPPTPSEACWEELGKSMFALKLYLKQEENRIIDYTFLPLREHLHD